MNNLLFLTSHDASLDFEYYDFLQGLAQKYNITLVCHPEYQGSLLSLGLRTKRLACKSRISLTTISSLKKIIMDASIDLIYTQTNRWLSVAIFSTMGMKKKPAVFVRRGICKPVYRYRIEDYLTYYHSALSGVITISNAAKEALTECGYPEKMVAAIHPGMKQDYFPLSVDRKNFRVKNDIPYHATLVMCIANRRPVKGLDRIIQAAQSLFKEDVYWCLIGDGCDEGLLEELKVTYSGKIRLMGFQQDAYQYLTAADIYVQPSRMEGLSYGLIQGMLKGCCPVVSRTGGMVELVEDNVNGFIFENDDAKAVDQLADYILRLHNDPELRQEFIKNSQLKLTQDFNITDMINKTHQFFQLQMNSR